MKLKLKVNCEARTEIDPNARKIIFAHNRALGDGIMFTAGIRDFKLLFPGIRINVQSNMPNLWDNNPYIDRSLVRSDPGVEFYSVGYSAIASANNTYVHFTQMFLLDMIAAVDHIHPLPISAGELCAAFANGEVGDPDMGNPEKNSMAREPFISLRKKYRGFCEKFSRQRGDIHLSDEEKNVNVVRDTLGIEGPYWVVAPGGKRDCTAKIWDWRRFQQVVDYFRGRLTFVVIGKSDLLIEPIEGTVSLVDKYNDNVRGLFSLIHNADGNVSGPSFLMHAAAALKKPCVTIFGGREPTAWSWYCNHQILHTNGSFSCCNSGGCWVARTVPLPKDPKHNLSLCKKPLQCDGRTIQSCMDVITSDDVIRAIGRYYEGDLRSYGRSSARAKPDKIRAISITTVSPKGPEIVMVGNLHTQGGGEQSLCTLARTLQKTGWFIYLYSWRGVHDKHRSEFKDLKFKEQSFVDGMWSDMPAGKPLLFYANDSTREFADSAEEVVNKSSSLVIGINYVNRPLTTCDWLARSGKLKAVIFQNQEKRDEWDREAVGFENTELVVLFGAIDLDKFLEVCTKPRDEKDDLVVLKHCVSDYRKYVTNESEGKGDKPHIWQKHLSKDKDTKFYARLLKEVPRVRFEFMEAPDELRQHFKDESRMVFHKWDSMPVPQFLSRGHVYLYRTSNLWRDQYPRVLAESLAAGLPALSEPRDGTKDRIMHGDTGFYCVDHDGFKYALKMLERKEKLRQAMGQHAKDWARKNLDPREWSRVLGKLLYSSEEPVSTGAVENA